MPDRRLFDSTSLTTPPEPRVEVMTCTVENMASDEPVQMSQGFVTCPPYDPTAMPMMIGDQLIWLRSAGPPELVTAPSKTSGAR